LTVAFHAEPQNPAGGAGQGDVSTLTRRVVLVTIDGMRGDYLGNADAYQIRIPNLRRLMHEGSYSPGTLSVFPTLTGTAHTALVTGTGAMKHGILCWDCSCPTPTASQSSEGSSGRGARSPSRTDASVIPFEQFGPFTSTSEKSRGSYSVIATV